MAGQSGGAAAMTALRSLVEVTRSFGFRSPGGPPGSRSRHLGIKRGMHMVGLVRWCRNHPRIKENLSGGVGFVRWCWIGLWDEMWDLRSIAVVQHAGSRRANVALGAVGLVPLHGADLSMATSGISSGGPKPCSTSQRTLSRHRNDHHARMRSRSTLVP